MLSLIVQFNATHISGKVSRISAVLSNVDFIEFGEFPSIASVALKSGTSFILYGEAAVFFNEAYDLYAIAHGKTPTNKKRLPLSLELSFESLARRFTEIDPIISVNTGAVAQSVRATVS